MTVSADDKWISAARARAGSGGWERDADTIFDELKTQAREARGTVPAQPGCPACSQHPEMTPFPRYEFVSSDPFLYCQACYGFWAVGDALARGVADPGFVHPALEAVTGPRRCKACFGHLKPDDACASCGLSPALLNCPRCSKPMERFREGRLSLDQCPECRGTWFDTGEISAAFKLKPAQSLAASTVDEHATDDDPPGWLIAAHVLGRMLLPFLPL